MHSLIIDEFKIILTTETHISYSYFFSLLTAFFLHLAFIGVGHSISTTYGFEFLGAARTLAGRFPQF